jgi:hypothetical protein
MRKAPAAWLITVVFAGCSVLGNTQRAHEKRTDQELTAAGFRQFPADTPEKMARLRTLPPLIFSMAERAGKPYYTMADPDGCRCLWVGSKAAYQRLQDLEIHRDIASSDRAIVKTDRETVAAEDTPGDRFDPFDPAFFPATH